MRGPAALARPVGRCQSGAPCRSSQLHSFAIVPCECRRGFETGVFGPWPCFGRRFDSASVPSSRLQGSFLHVLLSRLWQDCHDRRPPTCRRMLAPKQEYIWRLSVSTLARCKGLRKLHLDYTQVSGESSDIQAQLPACSASISQWKIF